MYGDHLRPREKRLDPFHSACSAGRGRGRPISGGGRTVTQMPSENSVKTAEELRASNAELERIVGELQARITLAAEASPQAWWKWDLAQQRCSTLGGDSFSRGYPLVNLAPLSEGWKSALHPDDSERVQGLIENCLQGAADGWECELRIKGRDGNWFWIKETARVARRDPDRRPNLIHGHAWDISAHKSATESIARDLTLLGHVDDAILCLDLRGIYTYWNKGAELLYGWKAAELLGQSMADRFLSADDRGRFERLFLQALNGENFGGEREYARKDGKRVWVDAKVYGLRNDRGEIIGCMEVARDISDRRRDARERARVEQQLYQAQKMETLGTLAGGIAHDFNNLLLLILGYTEVVTEMIPPDHAAQAKLAHIRKAGDRASGLVSRILTFSRKRDQPREPLVLSKLVADSVPLLRASLPAAIEIITNIDTGPRMVMADPVQLQQVLLNLYVNAGHAMKPEGGRLLIDVLAVAIKHPTPVVVGNLSAGNYLSISVVDNGVGMTPEIMAHAFEPFFTTKGVGTGSGLGLSIVNRIISSHGGAVQLSSRPGVGTAISILLPEINVTAGRAPSASPSRFGRGELGLVVDDDESIAQLTTQALEVRGFRTKMLLSGQSCIDHLDAHADQVDFIVTDQSMPNMTGSEMGVALRRKGHRTPILIVSGFGLSITPAVLQQVAPADFLAKPFALDTLAHAVTQLLDKHGERHRP
jgi:PAS domain S-box-containing protein